MAICPLGDHFASKRKIPASILLIVLLILLIVAFVIPLCLNTTFKVFERFGALKGKSYLEILGLQILKTLREEKNIEIGRAHV